jgi:hypothetical protein
MYLLIFALLFLLQSVITQTPSEGAMGAQAVLTVSAAVVALTQILKWTGIPDKFGPIAVLILAAIGVAVWGYSQRDFNQTTTFAYFAGWIAVGTSAAGVFGFTRAASSAVTAATTPPGGGAGSNPTVK